MSETPPEQPTAVPPDQDVPQADQPQESDTQHPSGDEAVPDASASPATGEAGAAPVPAEDVVGDAT